MCTVTYGQLSFSADLLPLASAAGGDLQYYPERGRGYCHGDWGNTINEAAPLLLGCELWWDNDYVLQHSDL